MQWLALMNDAGQDDGNYQFQKSPWYKKNLKTRPRPSSYGISRSVYTLPTASYPVEQGNTLGLDRLIETVRSNSVLRNLLSQFVIERIESHLKELWAELGDDIADNWEFIASGPVMTGLGLSLSVSFATMS